MERILDALAEGSSRWAASRCTGIRRGRLEALLKILAVDDVVAKTRDGWKRPAERVLRRAEVVRPASRTAAEADLMRGYATAPAA